MILRVNVSDVGRNLVLDFQIFGPQTKKAHFPNWVNVVTTTASVVREKAYT